MPVDVSCSNSPLRFGNGETGAVLIVRDISRQKRMEKALAESEERLPLAVQSSNIGTWDLNFLSGAVNVDEACRVAPVRRRAPRQLGAGKRHRSGCGAVRGNPEPRCPDTGSRR
jgi:PAS domain-containing protein